MAYIYIEPTEKVYAKTYKVFRGNPNGSVVDIKTKYPEVDYTKLTNDDFVCGYIRDDSKTGGEFWYSDREDRNQYVTQLTISHSYNPTTGKLTISKNTSYATNGNAFHVDFSGLVVEVIMIVDGVRSEYT